MKLFSYLVIVLFLISTDLSAESSDLNQYKIEIIIFKHLDNQPKESFKEVMELPSENIIKFNDEKIYINRNIINKPIKKDFWYSGILSNITLNKDRDVDKEESYILPNPGLWFRKNSNLETLKKINRKLQITESYEVLDSYSWIQNIPVSSESVFLFEENQDKNYGYYLKFYRNRFMHVDLKAYLGYQKINYKNEDLKYIDSYEERIINKNREEDELIKLNLNLNKKNNYLILDTPTNSLDIKPDDTSEEEINIFIDEEKRIFDNEIHYFDHPSFGVIISIKQV
ncbi:peptidoglycan binding protein CsiV [Gammaproteobacteria bacterium]|nr:peptidoglycan binding protein CsiV [Gammaproteobacteria bacterium]